MGTPAAWKGPAMAKAKAPAPALALAAAPGGPARADGPHPGGVAAALEAAGFSLLPRVLGTCRQGECWGWRWRWKNGSWRAGFSWYHLHHHCSGGSSGASLSPGSTRTCSCRGGGALAKWALAEGCPREKGAHWTMAHIAAGFGHEELVRWLIQEQGSLLLPRVLGTSFPGGGGGGGGREEEAGNSAQEDDQPDPPVGGHRNNRLGGSTRSSGLVSSPLLGELRGSDTDAASAGDEP